MENIGTVNTKPLKEGNFPMKLEVYMEKRQIIQVLVLIKFYQKLEILITQFYIKQQKLMIVVTFLDLRPLIVIHVKKKIFTFDKIIFKNEYILI